MYWCRRCIFCVGGIFECSNIISEGFQRVGESNTNVSCCLSIADRGRPAWFTFVGHFLRYESFIGHFRICTPMQSRTIGQEIGQKTVFDFEIELEASWESLISLWQLDGLKSRIVR